MYVIFVSDLRSDLFELSMRGHERTVRSDTNHRVDTPTGVNLRDGEDEANLRGVPAEQGRAVFAKAGPAAEAM